MNWKKFGADVLKKRKSLDLSVRDMAERCHTTHATLSRAERGKPVSVESFLKIMSYALDKDPRLYLV